MPSHDRYQSFSEMARFEGVTYQVVVEARRSWCMIAAPHGGGIEPGTSEIARALAHERHSLYLFESRLDDGGRHLHLTSGRFDEPQALRLVASAQTVITVHGFDSQQHVTYVGGRDRLLADHI
ncbi:MAG: poly-gamma-glutamate hydrolase family protein, partial [Anaerolineaceae bacterium]|nr:poly-gamma-glutamate hydrolase family protein [Anaerolineaceae bacterium]